MVGARIDDDTVVVHPSERGRLKQVLLKLGWPAEDLAGYVDGEAHPIELREDGWTLRDYQRQAVEGFWHGGSGVVVLPCGAGKTLVGAAAMALAKATTLILVTNTVVGPAVARRAAQAHDPDRGRDRRVLRGAQGDPAGHDRDLPGPDHQAEGRLPPPRPVRRPRLGPDHLRRGAPAARPRSSGSPPTCRPAAASGLTATLVREDGREGDVFSPDRAQALRRALEGHRGAGLDRPGRLRRGAGRRCPTPSGWPTRWPSPTSATGWPRPRTRSSGSSSTLVARHPDEPGAGDRAVPRPARTSSARRSTPR